MATFLAILLMLFGTAFFITIAIVINAFVVSVIWNWFMPVIFGLPFLTIPQAIGISLVIGCFIFIESKDAKTKKEKNEAMIGVVARPLFLLLIGWIVKSYFL